MSETIQKTLFEYEFLTLDSTCSDRKIWPRFASIRIDIQREARPDIQASACFLPFRSGIFREIYCDPPHRIGRYGQGFGLQRSNKGLAYQRFSCWQNKEEYFKFLEAVDREFSRTLEAGGTLHFKTTEGNLSHGTMIERKMLDRLSNFQTVREERAESMGYFARANRLKGKSASYVVFVDFLNTEGSKQGMKQKK